jgi:MOSC domain-containing protein YiiM
MQLLSVNIAQPRPVEHQGRTVLTGIFKEPVTGAVLLQREGLEGDSQADLKVHGGPDKAAYAYPFEHYAWWQDQLGREPFPHGQFGETLTVSGLLEDEVAIGDRFRIGTAVLEVSQPRTPCFKLGIRMGLADFPRRFQDSGRVGFYLRVIETGQLCAGDAIELLSRHEPRHTVQELWRWSHLERGNREAARRAVALEPLAASWKEKFAQRL